MRKPLFLFVLALSFSAGVLATLAVQRWNAHQDIAIMITRARTRADHAALASYCEAEAADNRSKADFHARLAKTYNQSHPGWQLGMHCEDMSQYFHKIADQDSDLAPISRQNIAIWRRSCDELASET